MLKSVTDHNVSDDHRLDVRANASQKTSVNKEPMVMTNVNARALFGGQLTTTRTFMSSTLLVTRITGARGPCLLL